MFSVLSVGNVRKESHLTSALDSGRQRTLMLCAGTGHTTGKDLCALGDELAKLCNILVVDGLSLLCTEKANLLTLVVRTEGTLSIVSIHFLNPLFVFSLK